MSSTRHAQRFALVDCDNFYVACERVFQPGLKKRPVVVLSNNDGVIVSRSPEVKALGVGMAKPYHQVKDIIERAGVVVFSSNYTLYGDMSRRVMTSLRSITPALQVYSIDEAFLYLQPGDGEEFGRRVRDTVMRETGIPVTVGMARTRTLAKLAAERAKALPELDHVYDLATPEEETFVLDHVAAQDVWGIGYRTAEWLYARGVKTALQVVNLPDETIRKKAGITGLRVVQELRGISCVTLTGDVPRQMITSSRSFGRYVTTKADLYESLATHAVRAAEKLREDDTVAEELSAFITTNTFARHPQYANTATVTIIPATNAGQELIHLAGVALDHIYREGYRYIKAGIILSRITPAGQRQLDMFARRNIERQDRLYRAIDNINDVYGRDAVQFLSCGLHKNWAMRRDYRSPRFTTRWEELPRVRV